MSWPTALLVYAVIWWLVLFCILPLGIRPSDQGDIGESAGAPSNPRLLWRVLVTTGVAAVVFAGVYALIVSDLISFRRM